MRLNRATEKVEAQKKAMVSFVGDVRAECSTIESELATVRALRSRFGNMSAPRTHQKRHVDAVLKQLQAEAGRIGEQLAERQSGCRCPPVCVWAPISLTQGPVTALVARQRRWTRCRRRWARSERHPRRSSWRWSRR